MYMYTHTYNYIYIYIYSQQVYTVQGSGCVLSASRAGQEVDEVKLDVGVIMVYKCSVQAKADRLGMHLRTSGLKEHVESRTCSTDRQLR